MPGNTFLGKAGPLGTAIAMGIAALIMIIIAFNYNFMINKYPVAGGEFTYTQQAFGEKHAFVCSWFLGLSYLAIVPLNATALALIGRNLMNNVFQIGFHYTVAGYDIYFGEILLAVVALLLFAFLSIRGVKFTGVFQTGLVFALVGGVLIITVAALVNPNVSFSNLSPGFYPGNVSIAGILAVVAVAPWAFVGFDTIPQAAEEFKFSTKKTKTLMILSILFGHRHNWRHYGIGIHGVASRPDSDVQLFPRQGIVYLPDCVDCNRRSILLQCEKEKRRVISAAGKADQ